jgi:hypothetical protein
MVIRTAVIAALFDDVVLILKLTDPEMKVFGATPDLQLYAVRTGRLTPKIPGPLR